MMALIYSALVLSILKIEMGQATCDCWHGSPCDKLSWAVPKDGLYWAWASPCSGHCSDLPHPLPNGWRRATDAEWARGYPSLAEFGNGAKCAAHIFDPKYNHCDASDFSGGYVIHHDNNHNYETLLVHDGCGGKEYYLGGYVSSYNEGINKCKATGGIISSFGDRNEFEEMAKICDQEYFKNHVNYCYIGFADHDGDGNFQFHDGTPFNSFGLWKPGEPHLSSTSWRCGLIDETGATDYIYDGACSWHTPFPVICHRKPTAALSEPGDEISNNDYPYAENWNNNPLSDTGTTVADTMVTFIISASVIYFIAGLLIVVLMVNCIYMFYKNCKSSKSKTKISYHHVKGVDSEYDNSEVEQMNV